MTELSEINAAQHGDPLYVSQFAAQTIRPFAEDHMLQDPTYPYWVTQANAAGDMGYPDPYPELGYSRLEHATPPT